MVIAQTERGATQYLYVEAVKPGMHTYESSTIRDRTGIGWTLKLLLEDAQASILDSSRLPSNPSNTKDLGGCEFEVCA